MKLKLLRKVWYRINPKHKDRLFCTLFGKEKYKRYALELYNAVNHSNYTNPSMLEIITLEDAIYIRMKNDVAYLISGDLVLYEHQSIPNPNLPIRGFMYYGELYSKLLKREKKNIYGRSLVKIPTPQYIVFYNGEENYPEKQTLKLSDAFIKPVNTGDFEFTATVYNINPGMNRELLDSCEPLKGYCTFIEKVRYYCKILPVEEATDRAVKECIDSDIISDVLSEERSAVVLEMLTTFDEKEYYEGLKEDFREEGREEERKNTERERKRADDAEKERDAAIKRAEAAEAKIREMEKSPTRSSI